MQAKSRFPLGDADNIQFRIKCGIDILGAIQEVMECGKNDISNYTDAVYGVYDYLSSLNDELRESIEACFEEERENADKEEAVA